MTHDKLTPKQIEQLREQLIHGKLPKGVYPLHPDAAPANAVDLGALTDLKKNKPTDNTQLNPLPDSLQNMPKLRLAVNCPMPGPIKELNKTITAGIDHCNKTPQMTTANYNRCINAIKAGIEVGLSIDRKCLSHYEKTNTITPEDNPVTAKIWASFKEIGTKLEALKEEQLRLVTEGNKLAQEYWSTACKVHKLDTATKFYTINDLSGIISHITLSCAACTNTTDALKAIKDINDTVLLPD